MKAVSPPKKREPMDADALTGAQFARIRAAFKITQVQMAEELGIGLRSVIRFEGTKFKRQHITLSYAKHVRCMARIRGIDLTKLLK
jgi:DNA-binding XRE family transcriptional regulator